MNEAEEPEMRTRQRTIAVGSERLRDYADSRQEI